MKQFNLKMPGLIYSGENALENVDEIVKAVNKVAVFTDKSIQSLGLIDTVLNSLKEANKEYTIFNSLPVEPSCDQAQEVIDDFKNHNADLIIAIGGGSVMDIAKLASVAATDKYTVRDLIDDPSQAVKNIKTLMIPTTAGTGSEATPNSIVLVPEKELKVGIVSNAMIADYVILDPDMIKKLPLKIAASTGIDALTHAIECYTSKKATPFSDMYALEALDLIFNNIEKACTDIDAMTEKNAMMLAAFYAGVAITASGTTAIHALAYPLGGKYHIPHGVSTAMMMVPVMRFNAPTILPQLAKVYDRVSDERKELSLEEKADWVINKLDYFINKLEIPNSLRAFGIGDEDLDALIEGGLDVKRLLVNNYREVSAEDARKLFLEIM